MIYWTILYYIIIYYAILLLVLLLLVVVVVVVVLGLARRPALTGFQTGSGQKLFV